MDGISLILTTRATLVAALRPGVFGETKMIRDTHRRSKIEFVLYMAERTDLAGNQLPIQWPFEFHYLNRDWVLNVVVSGNSHVM